MAMSKPTGIDHLVYAVSDLDRGVAEMERLLGVRAVPGGRHLGRGTRNALLGLGGRTYLEVIAPDPAQSQAPSWFRVSDLQAPTLVTWAAASRNLEADAAAAERAGVRLGSIIAGERTRTDGVELRWRYTDPSTFIADGIVPFLIDWGATPHPSSAIPSGGMLIEL